MTDSGAGWHDSGIWQIEVWCGLPLGADKVNAPMVFGPMSMTVGDDGPSEVSQALCYGPVCLHGDGTMLRIQVPTMVEYDQGDGLTMEAMSYSDVRVLVNAKVEFDNFDTRIRIEGWELDGDNRPVWAVWFVTPFEEPTVTE